MNGDVKFVAGNGYLNVGVNAFIHQVCTANCLGREIAWMKQALKKPR